MKHRHSGPKVQYRRKGRTYYRKRPLHKKTAPQWKAYHDIIRKARKKGYKVLNINRRNLTVDEVDIPEIYRTDGLIVPDHEGKKRRDLIFIDDDAIADFKKKAFAHELGHSVLFNTGQDDEKDNSNNPKIERKADKIGADILGMSVKDFNSPDVTYMDTKNARKFIFGEDDPIEEGQTREGQYMFPRQPQSLFHAGDEPPSERIEKGEPLFGFSNIEDAERWKEKHGKEGIWQFQTDEYDMDPKTYSRGDKYSDDEFVAGNVIEEEEIKDEED